MQNVRIAPNDRAIDEKKTNVVEDVMPLFSASDKEIPAIKHLENNPEARRKYFANPQHRKGREIPKNASCSAPCCSKSLV